MLYDAAGVAPPGGKPLLRHGLTVGSCTRRGFGIVALTVLAAIGMGLGLLDRGRCLDGAPSSRVTAPRATGPAVRQAKYHDAYLEFRYPAQWQAARYEEHSSFTSALVFVSNQTMHDPCARTPTSIVCHEPVGSLGPNGVLVEWDVDGYPGWTLAGTPGTPLRIGGRPARERVEEARGTCVAGHRASRSRSSSPGVSPSTSTR